MRKQERRGWIFLIVSAVIFLSTIFLPVIVSFTQNNWWFMILYWIIPIPVFFEVVIFFAVFSVLDETHII